MVGENPVNVKESETTETELRKSSVQIGKKWPFTAIKVEPRSISSLGISLGTFLL